MYLKRIIRNPFHRKREIAYYPEGVKQTYGSVKQTYGRNRVKFIAKNKWRFARGQGYTGAALGIFNTVMLVRLTFGLNLSFLYTVLFGIGLAFGIVFITWLVGYIDVKSHMVAYEQEYVTGELNPFMIEMDRKLNYLFERTYDRKTTGK
jgi:hypothetical protein